MSRRVILLIMLIQVESETIAQVVPRPRRSETLQTKQFDPRINKFVHSEWSRVGEAEEMLREKPNEAMPLLVELLDYDVKVKLRNTADLIYPGATKFYGHGWVIDYDLDWITVRAGWLIEKLTFHDFGFSDGAIKEEVLLAATKAGLRDVALNKVITRKLNEKERKEHRARAVARMKAWWKANQHGWSRWSSLKLALQSKNTRDNLMALKWLQFAEFGDYVEGFNRVSFDEDIFPLIRGLSDSDDGNVSKEAKSLLDWFKTTETIENYWANKRPKPTEIDAKNTKPK